MATASKVHLEASQQPQFYVKGLTAESAEKTSQLLQLNHEKYHIFFRPDGFHVTTILPAYRKCRTDRVRRTTLRTTC
jgi:hypothetical protein